MKNTIQKNSFLDYFIVTLLIVVTDNPFFMINKYLKLYFLIFLILVYFFKKGDKKMDKGFFIVVILTVAMILIQGFLWKLEVFTLFSYVGLALLLPYLVFKIVGIRYLEVGANIIFAIAVYTFFLWFAQSFIPPLDAALIKLSKLAFPYTTDKFPRSILIYTVGQPHWHYLPQYGVYRNMGSFHEPGAFATFINIAIVINLMTSGKLFSKKNLYLIFILLTTFSTAGILSFFMIVFFYYLNTKSSLNPITKLFVGFFLASIFMFISLQFDFLSTKITSQIDQESTRSLNEKTVGRFYGARKSLLVLQRYPLTGKGLISSTRAEGNEGDEAAKYGFMSFFSRIGIILILLYVIFFIRGIKRISVYFSGSLLYWQILFFSLMVNLFAQKFINDPFIMIILFIGVLNKHDFNTIIQGRKYLNPQIHNKPILTN